MSNEAQEEDSDEEGDPNTHNEEDQTQSGPVTPETQQHSHDISPDPTSDNPTGNQAILQPPQAMWVLKQYWLLQTK